MQRTHRKKLERIIFWQHWNNRRCAQLGHTISPHNVTDWHYFNVAHKVSKTLL